MALQKLLLVELKKDSDSEGVVVDRIAHWDKNADGQMEATILFGVHWISPPKGRDPESLSALEYYPPEDLTTFDVLDSLQDLDNEEEEA